VTTVCRGCCGRDRGGRVHRSERCFFFKVEDARLHGILVTLLAFFMGLVIFMISRWTAPSAET